MRQLQPWCSKSGRRLPNEGHTTNMKCINSPSSRTRIRLHPYRHEMEIATIRTGVCIPRRPVFATERLQCRPKAAFGGRCSRPLRGLRRVRSYDCHFL